MSAVSPAVECKRKNYLYIIYDLFKVKQTILLLFVGVFGYLIAAVSNIDLFKFLLIIISLFLTIGGTTGFNMIFDADLDAIMMRTRNRVIPSGLIDRREALIISLSALALGLYIGWGISTWFFIAGLLGFIIDIAVYTLIMKRKTWLSVVLGGFAGGMPAFGGYLAHVSSPDLYSISLMLIVALWSSPHIWYISSYYIEDYVRARIPTLPVVKGFKASVKASMTMISLILLVVLTMFIYSNLRLWITLTVSLIMSINLLKIMYSHLISFNKENIRRTFKFLSPYLAIIFISLYIDRLLGF
ncbi:MAG: UbiA family prenyltransferase [Sulfolobales archaeon]